MPDLTVLMSVYNGMPYLPEAIDSVLNQTFGDFVFRIIDDGSEDGSFQYLEGLRDPRVEVVRQPHCGLGAALNRGLSLCNTEYLARMDADDLIPSNRLEVQMHFLRAHHEVGMVGTQFHYFHDPCHPSSMYARRLPREHDAIYGDLLEGRLPLVHASLMMRTHLLRRIGGYRVSGIGEDWDMFLRMAEVTRLANVEEVLYSWRIHPDSVCMRHVAETQLRIAYACACALHRNNGRTEPTYEEFLAGRRGRPFWERWRDYLDYYGLAQYRGGVGEILTSRWLRGHLRLGWAALCSPTRACARIAKIWRTRGARRIPKRRAIDVQQVPGVPP